MTRINMQWLVDHEACSEGLESFKRRLGADGEVDAVEHLCYLAQNDVTWGLWLAVRLPEFDSIKAPCFFWLLTDPEHGTARFTAEGSPQRDAIEAVAALWHRVADGEMVSSDEWQKAADAACVAAREAHVAGAAWPMRTMRTAEAAWAAAWAARAAVWTARAARAAEESYAVADATESKRASLQKMIELLCVAHPQGGNSGVSQ